ncbi:hypothetical protein L1987_43179 [Smallanthus sonchifolius]|uniref:Uncharacterized protein n=1 Tax=Smallanthus sonchifolius TaxID=185202 RepID=A0ACB9GKX4_9ASTR|nr:hypothetical protein L1987_43179 [Smallanthus sonchifolius]
MKMGSVQVTLILFIMLLTPAATPTIVLNSELVLITIKTFRKVRRLNEEKGYVVAIMMDTDGNEIHIGDLCGASSAKAKIGSYAGASCIDHQIAPHHHLQMQVHASDEPFLSSLVLNFPGSKIEEISKSNLDETSVKNVSPILTRATRESRKGFKLSFVELKRKPDVWLRYVSW